MITPDDVSARVQAIRDAEDNDPEGHYLADKLYLELLTAIAVGDVFDPTECARRAIEADKVGFARWYE